MVLSRFAAVVVAILVIGAALVGLGMGQDILPTWGEPAPGTDDATAPGPGGGDDDGDTGGGDKPSLDPLAGRAYDGAAYLTLPDWQDLMGERGWNTRWDDVDRVFAQSSGDRELRLLAGVPVMEQNGQFKPLAAGLRVTAAEAKPDSVLVPAAVLSEAFGWEVSVAQELTGDGAPEDGETIRLDVTPADGSGWPAAQTPPSSREAIVDHLSFLQRPIPEAQPGFRDTHVPGAARAYRNGTHEGFDWYGYAIGVPVTRDTQVHAMADGVVIRAGHDWRTPSSQLRGDWLAAADEAGHTPEWVLDRLRGRQVWVRHDSGVMIRYAHLSGIPSGVRVGTEVEAGAVVGYVGNSGTSQEVAGTDEGLHLHSDILIHGANVFLDYDPQALREMMGEILDRS